MRTLREWDKYLKQQELALKKDAKKTPAETTPAPDVRRTELPAEDTAPRAGPIIAVTAKTPSEGAQIESYTVPELDDFVPAVSEPRPIPKEPTTSEPRPTPETQDTGAETTQPGLFQAPPKKRTAPKSTPARAKRSRGRKASRQTGSISRRLKELPPSVREFFATDADETAEKYYTKGFKENRHQLIERLLDPPLSLEEAARVLGVCPTTVRRYTNKGLLKHFRTAGNQRRFRLSDVIVFVESRSLTSASGKGGSDLKAESPQEAPSQPAPAKAASAKRAAARKAPTRKATSPVRKADKARTSRKTSALKPARKRRTRAATSRR